VRSSSFSPAMPYFFGTYQTALETRAAARAGGLEHSLFGHHLRGSSLRLRHRPPRSAKRTIPARARRCCSCSIFFTSAFCALQIFQFRAVDAFVALFTAFGLHVSAAAPAAGASLRHLVLHLRDDELHHRRVPARDRPARRYLDYLLFVCFFPHLVAGPIVALTRCCRSSRAPPCPTAGRQARGLFRIPSASRKRLPSATCSRFNLVGRVFDNPERYSSVEVLVAIYAYAMQIYADFSATATWPSAAPPSRLRASRELRRSLSGEQPARFLAPLAHLAEHLASRLFVHPAGWLKGAGDSHYPQRLMITMLRRGTLGMGHLGTFVI